MEIVGYVGFAALILLAAIWTLGVRVKLDAGTHTILGALFFLVGAIGLGISGADKLHSLWIIPAGFIFSVLLGLIAGYAPSLFGPFRFLASIFTGIFRVGIPAHKIKAAQEAGLKASIEEFASKAERKE